MIHAIQSVLGKLERYKNSPFPILSVYLGSPEPQTAPALLMVSRFHSLLHQSLDKKEYAIFTSDIERMERCLRESYDRRGNKSIVFFSAGNHVFEAMPLPFHLQSLCVIAYSPYIAPILEAIRAGKSYLVLLVDHKQARLFTAHWGIMKEYGDAIDGQVPQRAHLDCHLQLVSDAAERFLRDHPVSFVVIGGHKELLGKLKKHFPASLRKMVLGQFITKVNIPLQEALTKSEALAAKIYNQHE